MVKIDFLPFVEDDESAVEEESDIEETEEVEIKQDKKRSLPENEDDDRNKEDVNVKKSRIDAIWADMNSPTKPVTDSSAATVAQQEKKEEPATVVKKKSTPLNIKRPKSSLSSLVSQYNIKEPKLNTLEKSKLDWRGYVDREGIKDDLKYKNKDGYMEKVAFLQRVDDRRLNDLKSGQKKKE